MAACRGVQPMVSQKADVQYDVISVSYVFVGRNKSNSDTATVVGKRETTVPEYVLFESSLQ